MSAGHENAIPGRVEKAPSVDWLLETARDMIDEVSARAIMAENEQLRARLSALEAALDNYGRHNDDCNVMERFRINGDHHDRVRIAQGSDMLDCTCGFRAIVETTP